jgi:glutathione S-transferase
MRRCGAPSRLQDIIMTTTLHGWSFSPFVRAVRVALLQKNIAYTMREMTPGDLYSEEGRKLSPLGKVPILVHDDLALTETLAILRYVDSAFPGPKLESPDPRMQAIDDMLALTAAHHLYPDGVMGVFLHEVYVPANGGTTDADLVDSHLAKSVPALDVLNQRLRSPSQSEMLLRPAEGLIAAFLANMALGPKGAEAVRSRFQLRDLLERADRSVAFSQTKAPVPLFGLG